jgi:hypothetical protein
MRTLWVSLRIFQERLVVKRRGRLWENPKEKGEEKRSAIRLERAWGKMKVRTSAMLWVRLPETDWAWEW